MRLPVCLGGSLFIFLLITLVILLESNSGNVSIASTTQEDLLSVSDVHCKLGKLYPTAPFGDFHFFLGRQGRTKVMGSLTVLENSYLNSSYGLHIVDGKANSLEEANSLAFVNNIYNPLGELHGCPPDLRREMGSLGNIAVDEMGTGVFTQTNEKLVLSALPGKTLLIRQSQDFCTPEYEDHSPILSFCLMQASPVLSSNLPTHPHHRSKTSESQSLI